MPANPINAMANKPAVTNDIGVPSIPMVYLSIVIAVLLLLAVARKKQQRERRSEKIIEVNHDNCSRCRSCVSKCKHDVLDLMRNEQGQRVMILRPDQCTGCGKCLEVCRFDALTLVVRK
jgi:NAD-dependent dihydropyrimidine dehydrogenase PreA subunit